MMMKRFLAPLALLSLPLLSPAQDLPTLSPTATIQQRIGLTDISITYSRPSAKGRKIFGDLVPYNELWRLGANKCTLLQTTGILYLDGGKLPAGKYAVFAMPWEREWEIVFNSDTELWGTDGYDQKKDVLRVKARKDAAPMAESFSIGFENLAQDKGDLVFRWETTQVALSMESPATEQGMANIQDTLSKAGADFRTYSRSASFALDRNADPKLAYEWASKSVSMEKKYWNMFTLAKAQAALEIYDQAIATGGEAIKLAEAEKDNGAVKSYGAKVAEWTAKAAGK